MPDSYLQAIRVRPILPEERQRFDDELDAHHWLGHHLVGETMRHVAIGPDGTWAALLGYGAAALACRPREQLIGWSDEVHFRRLRYIVNNQRYCVLPSVRRSNLASAVLARSLRRISDDYQARFGHPVLLGAPGDPAVGGSREGEDVHGSPSYRRAFGDTSANYTCMTLIP